MDRIVIAVSAFAGEHPAIEWGVQFAHDHAASVELVHVVDITWGHAPEDYIDSALLTARERLAEMAVLAQSRFPGTTVRSRVSLGSPITELALACEGADLLVVGAHPDDRSQRASSRVVRLAALSPCSVVVAPSNVIPTGTGVVVGVDGSVASDLAVAFAADLADRHGDVLTVILAWGQPEAWGFVEPTLFETDPTEEDLLIIAESIAGLAESYPDLEIVTEVSGSRPEHALTAASRDARMLVVGSRGRHGIARALLGSVSESVVSELPCAVAVVRGAVVAA
jgi:nucleotide-binding universal stress UspA family protein